MFLTKPVSKLNLPLFIQATFSAWPPSCFRWASARLKLAAPRTNFRTAIRWASPTSSSLWRSGSQSFRNCSLPGSASHTFEKNELCCLKKGAMIELKKNSSNQSTLGTHLIPNANFNLDETSSDPQKIDEFQKLGKLIWKKLFYKNTHNSRL